MVKTENERVTLAFVLQQLDKQKSVLLSRDIPPSIINSLYAADRKEELPE